MTLKKLNTPTPTSTVNRGKAKTLLTQPKEEIYKADGINVFFGDSLDFYDEWQSPTVIISDGAYGVLGFEGDTSDHFGLAAWYEKHVEAWSKKATGETTLWFWNSEIGWAAVHSLLEKFGWRYVNCNIWNKGLGHIAGNVNTKKIRRFPVVTEVCTQYIYEPKFDGIPLKNWLLKEWKRTGLKLKEANIACEVADVAVRKYLDQGHLWYWPPVEMFEKLSAYANLNGKKDGYPYFSINGTSPMTGAEWCKTRSKFYCPHGITNVWDRPALRGKERLKTEGNSGKAIHLNQKPLDLMKLIIEASSETDDVIWEPFGGTFSGTVAANMLKRQSFAAEIDSTYYQFGLERIKQSAALF